jgi:hypothetical protein
VKRSAVQVSTRTAAGSGCIQFRSGPLTKDRNFVGGIECAFRWRLPKDDSRAESRRVDQDTIHIVGQLKPTERERFLSNSIITSLDAERAAGRSLGLLKADILEFNLEKKAPEEREADRQKFAACPAGSFQFEISHPVRALSVPVQVQVPNRRWLARGHLPGLGVGSNVFSLEQEVW